MAEFLKQRKSNRKRVRTNDEKKTLYSKDGVVVKLCYYWEYFEVLGLPNDQCVELLDFYNDLAFEIEV